MNPNNLPARIYARISKPEDDFKIWKNQIPACQDYARQAGLTLEDPIYLDSGYTGRNANRPDYELMLQHITELGDRFAILVYKLDRLHRNVHMGLHLLEICLEYEIPIISATEPVDIFNPMGIMQYQWMLMMAEYESALISDRTKTALRKREKTAD